MGETPQDSWHPLQGKVGETPHGSWHPLQGTVGETSHGSSHHLQGQVARLLMALGMLPGTSPGRHLSFLFGLLPPWVAFLTVVCLKVNCIIKLILRAVLL